MRKRIDCIARSPANNAGDLGGSAVDFEFHLSPEVIATAVDTESETHDYLTDTYGQDSIEAILEIWPAVEQGELTYREASATLEMSHTDFLRGAAELDLFER